MWITEIRLVRRFRWNRTPYNSPHDALRTAVPPPPPKALENSACRITLRFWMPPTFNTSLKPVLTANQSKGLVWQLHVSTRNTFLAITLAKLSLVTALKLSPLGRGYELDGCPTANIVLKVHTLFFLFFFFFFAYYVVLLLTVYWRADLALFLRLDLEKEKNKEQIWPSAVRLKIIILRAVIQSWNRLWSISRRGNRQTKKSGFSTV